MNKLCRQRSPLYEPVATPPLLGPLKNHVTVKVLH